MSNVGVAEVWSISSKYEVMKTYSVETSNDALSMMSQVTWVDDSYSCKKVAMYSNFEFQATSMIDHSNSKNIVCVNED